jgi:hypothetical protein
VLPTPVSSSTIINSAADDKRWTITAAAPSTAAGSSSGSVLKIVTTANALVEGVSKLAKPVAKYTIPSDNLYESTGQISDSSLYKRGNLKMMRTMNQVNKVTRGGNLPLVRLRGNITRFLLERMKTVSASMLS